MKCWKSMVVVVVALVAGYPERLRAEDTYETLPVGETTYHGVTIVNRTPTDVFIRHAGGFANLKVEDLAPELLVALGYEAEPVQAAKPVVSFASLQQNPHVQAVQQQLATGLEGSVLKLHQTIVAGLLIAGFVMYLFTCYCCRLICLNAGTDPGALIWFPLLQMIPLLRAAGMPSWWFLVFLAPMVGSILVSTLMPTSLVAILLVLLVSLAVSGIGSTIWCVKIARACGKSPLVGVLLLLPITNFFAFLYLAFSGPSESPDALDPIRLNLSAS